MVSALLFHADNIDITQQFRWICWYSLDILEMPMRTKEFPESGKIKDSKNYINITVTRFIAPSFVGVASV